MAKRWTLFVEGKADRALVRCVLHHLCVSNVSVEMISGGVARLNHVAPQIQRRHDAGDRIAVLLDANANPQRRRRELQRQQADHGLPIERSFLLPDDRNPGCVETLLEEMAVAVHREIYDCFDAYERCLQRPDAGYQTPNRKARVYAWCEALGIETGTDKNYGDMRYWNLDAPGLEPMKRFLTGLGPLSSAPDDAMNESPTPA